MKNENISAFAFNTGRSIEEIIDKETNNLRDENNLLKAKILSFFNELKGCAHREGLEAEQIEMDTPISGIFSKYTRHFNIQVDNKGE